MTINLQMNGRWQLWRSVLKCQTYNPVSWALANSNDIFFLSELKKDDTRNFAHYLFNKEEFEFQHRF